VNISLTVLLSKWSKTRFFVTIAFQIYFKVCHYKGPGNPVGSEIEWDKSGSDFADEVNLLGYDINTIYRNTETAIDASKEIGLEINVEKTRYMLVFRDQN
jgi:hypothetical protein